LRGENPAISLPFRHRPTSPLRIRAAAEAGATGTVALGALNGFLWRVLIIVLPVTDFSLVSKAKSFGQLSTVPIILLWILLIPAMFKGALRPVIKNRAIQFLLAFWFVCAGSVLLTAKAPPSFWARENPWLKSISQFLQVSCICSVALFTALFVKTWKDFRTALNCYFVGFVLTVLGGLLELTDFYAGNDWTQAAMGFIHTFGGRQYLTSSFRLQLLGLEPSWAADYLLCVVPFFVLSTYYWRSRLFSTACSVISFLMFLGAASLGGMIALLGEIAAALAFLRRRTAAIFAISLLFPALLVFIFDPEPMAWLVDRARGIMTSGRDTEDFSARQRTASAETALNSFKAHPLTGVGIGVSYFYGLQSIPDWAVRDPMTRYMYKTGDETSFTVNNLFAVILAETGAVGFLPFVLMLVSMLRGTLRAYRNAAAPWKKRVCGSVFVILVGQIIHFMTVSNWSLRYWPFIWGLAIFLARPGVVSESPAPPTAPRSFTVRRRTLTAGSSRPAFEKEPAST